MADVYGICFPLDEFQAMNDAQRRALVAALVPLGIVITERAIADWLAEGPATEVDDICLEVTMAEQAQVVQQVLFTHGISTARLHRLDQHTQ